MLSAPFVGDGLKNAVLVSDPRCLFVADYLFSVHLQAEKFIRNEKTSRVRDKDGVFQPVADEGGRQHMQSLILDV